ncbi:hypothetical protein LB577_14690 [Mesorhizobium sp. B283B1A]|uniref:hypothetical protein n=1 Tax=Mesorhizobium TaxID=68287 RepID=UPI001CD1825A|nr:MULTISPECIES: hypothetical protein [Mesorhizobium]MCA0048191.1 hypothetical protein [Mesorhizobium sp. B283B1A]UQS67453.1 hypothetical protein M5D98_14480 [Mesorhizobium opportunistum]
MSVNWGEDDLARLLALEHAFHALALFSAYNYAHLDGTTPSAAVKQFREAVEGSVYDTGQAPKAVQVLMSKHLKKMFDHVAAMAVHADQGFRGDE